eukprot:832535_1
MELELQSTSDVLKTLSVIHQELQAQRREIIRIRENSISHQTNECFNRVRAFCYGACNGLIMNAVDVISVFKKGLIMGIIVLIGGILLQYHGVLYFTKTTVVSEGTQYVDPASYPNFPERERKPRDPHEKALEIKYLQTLERELMIEQWWLRHVDGCALEKRHVDEEINQLKEQIREIGEDLIETIGENGDQAKYSEAYLYQEGKRRMQLVDEKEEKETYAELIHDQMCALKQLNDSSTFRRYAEKGTFKWSDMMRKEGICADDSLGLCKILMRSNKGLEQRFEDVRLRPTKSFTICKNQ